MPKFLKSRLLFCKNPILLSGGYLGAVRLTPWAAKRGRGQAREKPKVQAWRQRSIQIGLGIRVQSNMEAHSLPGFPSRK